MKLLLMAMAGGALGSGLRFLVNAAGLRLLGPAFPWATFFVNVSGSFAMGLIIGWISARMGGSPALRTFLATGILGGFTTFSAYSLDFVLLMERRAYGAAAFYAGGSVALSILACIAGLATARVLWPPMPG